nr:hypothetical protein Iba_chr11cCG10350 [Ipomoea batatas]
MRRNTLALVSYELVQNGSQARKQVMHGWIGILVGSGFCIDSCLMNMHIEQGEGWASKLGLELQVQPPYTQVASFGSPGSDHLVWVAFFIQTSLAQIASLGLDRLFSPGFYGAQAQLNALPMPASKELGSYHLLLLLNTSLSRGLVPSGSPNPPLGSPEHREPTIEEFFTKWIVDSDDRHKEKKSC